MALDLHTLFGADTQTAVIQETTSGVPADLPPQLFTPTDEVSGDGSHYLKVDGNRKTAQQVAYGAASKAVAQKGVTKVPVTLLHTKEHQAYKPALMHNLHLAMNGTGSASDRALQQVEREIGRQIGLFRTRFTNLRTSGVASAICKGGIWFDAAGNLLPSSSGAAVSIDFGVPAGNKSQLDILGDGNVISASWATASTKIITDIRKMKAAARRKTGYMPRTAIYGDKILEYLLGNTQAKELINRSAASRDAAQAGEIPNGFGGLNWIPGGNLFYEDQTGTVQDWVGDNEIVFLPEVGPDWWQFQQGSLITPTEVGITGGSAAEIIGSFIESYGMFAYSTVNDEGQVKQIAGDTFLPIVANPNAIFQATVVF